MATIIGRQIELGLAKETTRGTAKTTADRWIRAVMATIIPRAEKATDETTRGRLEDGEGLRMVRQWYEGELEGIAHADALGWPFLNLYGSVSSAQNGTTGSYNHTFSVNQIPQHNSLTLFVKDGSIVQEVIANSMINTLELNATTDDFVRFKANFLGGAASSNAAAVTYGTEYDFVGRDISCKIATTSGGLAGASALPVKSISIKWDQGLIPNYVFGAYTPNDIYNSKLSIEGTMILDYTDTTFRDLWTSDNARYMQVKIQGAAIIGTGANNPTIDLTMNKVHVTDWSRSATSNDVVTQEVAFKAFYNAADSKQSTLVLTNLQSAY